MSAQSVTILSITPSAHRIDVADGVYHGGEHSTYGLVVDKTLLISTSVDRDVWEDLRLKAE